MGRDWMALVPVWRAGRSCRWLCPCRCHGEVVALFPAPARGPKRSSGLGGNNRIASTDRLRAWDEEPPSLLDDLEDYAVRPVETVDTKGLL